MSPAQRLARLKRVSKTLGELTSDHPATCPCILCDADLAAWKAKMDYERPGYRGNGGLLDNLPTDEQFHARTT